VKPVLRTGAAITTGVQRAEVESSPPAAPAAEPKSQKPDSFSLGPAAVVPEKIRVPEPEKVSNVSKALFGRELSPEECVALLAPPADAKVDVYANQATNSLGLRVEILWVYDTLWYFHRDESGALYAELQGWDNNEWGGAPRGMGTRLMAGIVEALAARGFSRIETTAVGPDGSPNPKACGHIAWPLMGFNMELPDEVRARLPESLKSATCLNELLLMDGGIEWWKHNAPTGHLPLTFSLEEGSTSREILDARMAAKGWKPGEVKPT